MCGRRLSCCLKCPFKSNTSCSVFLFKLTLTPSHFLVMLPLCMQLQAQFQRFIVDNGTHYLKIGLLVCSPEQVWLVCMEYHICIWQMPRAYLVLISMLRSANLGSFGIIRLLVKKGLQSLSNRPSSKASVVKMSSYEKKWHYMTSLIKTGTHPLHWTLVYAVCE